MKEEFMELDFDGNGLISINELERVVHSLRIKLKLTECEIREFLHEIDRDGDGNIDLKEYFKYMRGNIGTPLHSNLLYRVLFQLSLIRKDFHKFDVDGSLFLELFHLFLSCIYILMPNLKQRFVQKHRSSM